jgi:glycosyltransferase involved in cell wall biosynthesis
LKKTKKILFLVTESDWGGAQRFLIEFLPQLKKSKFTNKIIVAAGGQGSLLKELEKSDIKTVHLINLTHQHFSPLKDIEAFFNIYSLLDSEKPDILFLLSTKAGFYGAWAKLLFNLFRPEKIKIIYRIGGWAFTEKLPSWRKNIYFWLEKIVAPLKDQIIVVSKNDEQLAIEKNLCSANKIKVISNGLEIQTFRKELIKKTVARKKLKVNKNKLIIGTIANFYRNKGLLVLIDAANELFKQQPNLKEKIIFVIIGEGPERKIIETKIKQYQLDNFIQLTGPIPRARKYLNIFDIFTAPSLKEGFGWAILEATAAGLPIAATNVGGIPEIIEDKKTGLLVNPANHIELTEALKKLIEDKNLRKRLGQAAQLKSKQFSQEKMISEYLRLITQI